MKFQTITLELGMKWHKLYGRLLSRAVAGRIMAGVGHVRLHLNCVGRLHFGFNFVRVMNVLSGQNS